MNLSTKKQNITINKSTNNLAATAKSMSPTTKSVPATNISFKNFLGRIQGVSKGCSACGK
jgi:hypothetical protein